MIVGLIYLQKIDDFDLASRNVGLVLDHYEYELNLTGGLQPRPKIRNLIEIHSVVSALSTRAGGQDPHAYAFTSRTLCEEKIMKADKKFWV
jgi:hypothetical protein